MFQRSYRYLTIICLFMQMKGNKKQNPQLTWIDVCPDVGKTLLKYPRPSAGLDKKKIDRYLTKRSWKSKEAFTTKRVKKNLL